MDNLLDFEPVSERIL